MRPAKRQPRAAFIVASAIPLLIVSALLCVQYFRPIGPVAVTPMLSTTAYTYNGDGSLPLPRDGSAAVAVDGLGTVAVSGDARPRPVASVTKIMTALVILERHPLATGDQGPTMEVTFADVQNSLVEADDGQSVLFESEGQQLSELQLLQGLLVASANNFADLLATWDAGSIESFVGLMNAEAGRLGMKDTHYADASGYSPQSVSTPGDQILLARVALANPVFAEIVAMKQATLPEVGEVANVDSILGQDGIVGVKTGWTDQAGGCFVFAAKEDLAGRSVRIIGAVLGQETLDKALDLSKQLVEDADKKLRLVRVVTRGQTVGELAAPWGARAAIVADDDVNVLAWPGMSAQASLDVEPPRAPVADKSALGWLSLEIGEQAQRIPVKISTAFPNPGALWRLTRR